MINQPSDPSIDPVSFPDTSVVKIPCLSCVQEVHASVLKFYLLN